MQAGYLGLVDASRRYSAREGVTFAAYAAIRVRGSIIDCLRSNSNLCRTTISMQQKVRAAERDLEIEHQRTPTPEELSEKMEMTLEELQNWQAHFQASRVKSLDEVYTDHSILFQDFPPSPEEATYQSQMRGMLRKAISKLPEREARVLQLYYVAELNVYEVAAILDVTTGRISQIKRAAIERAHSLIMEQMDLGLQQTHIACNHHGLCAVCCLKLLTNRHHVHFNSAL
jgi:RNA polymerase sigma factor for flagellar operon FliA